MAFFIDFAKMPYSLVPCPNRAFFPSLNDNERIFLVTIDNAAYSIVGAWLFENAIHYQRPNFLHTYNIRLLCMLQHESSVLFTQA